MTRKVNAREFLHAFAKLERELRPGESVIVTRRGKPLGRFIKEAGEAKIPLPDFKKDACRPGYGTKVGDELLRRLLSDEAIS